MIKHIVLWKLKDTAHGNTKEQNAKLIKEKLEGLSGKIPGALKIEVGLDFSRTEQSSDIVLYAEFTDKAALDAYQEHPLHKAVMPFIMEARSERRVADYVAH